MSGSRSIRDDIETVLVTQQQIDDAVGDLASRLTEVFADRNPILIGALKGAFIFFADLVRRLDFPLEIDFVVARSYGNSTVPGCIDITTDVSCDLTGRHVVVIDDIVDTGQTRKALVAVLEERDVASVHTCCLLDKPERRRCDFQPDYVGIVIPDYFVVGYGLDFSGHHRNLPFVGVLRPELYSSSDQ